MTQAQKPRFSVSKTTMILAVVGLSGCGGGGSAPTTPSVTPPPAPPVQMQSLRFADQAGVSGLSYKTEFSNAVVGDPREYAGGAAGGDVDGDGDIDLVILRGDVEGNLLLLNDGTGSFSDATPDTLALPANGTANYRLSGPTLADMDGDGALDLFIGGLNGDPSLVFRGDGAGGFTDQSVGSGLEAMSSFNTVSAAFGDVDGDGDIDMIQSHWGTPRDRLAPGETETLWRNISTTGVIRFEAATNGSGIEVDLNSATGVLGPDHDYTFAPILTDLDGDRDLDLFHVADFRGTRIFMNDGTGSFTNATDTSQITDTNGMGAGVGDVDGDGDIDGFVSSINTNRLYRNDNGVMVNGTDAAGVELGGWGWGSCVADLDLDGDLDIYQTNGWRNDAGAPPQDPYTSDRTRLWLNDGSGVFEDVAQEARINDTDQGRGVVCADFDGDMDVDVLLMLSQSDPGVRLWINSIDGNGIKVRTTDLGANSQGLGARIFTNVGGVEQIRELRVGSNFSSHNPAEAIFGLDDASEAASVRIVWPDGTSETRANVAAGTTVVFDRADAN